MSIGLKGNADGSGAIQVGGTDALTISAGLNTAFAGAVSAGAITSTGLMTGATGALYPIVSATAVASTSGTSIDYTNLPSWVKRITVMFSAVSTSGTSVVQIQIGSGTFVTTGYSGIVTNTSTLVTSTTGFPIWGASATDSRTGAVTLFNITGNTWLFSGTNFSSSAVNGAAIASGTVALSNSLDRVRITTVNGTDTFDAGSLNILYE